MEIKHKRITKEIQNRNKKKKEKLLAGGKPSLQVKVIKENFWS